MRDREFSARLRARARAAEGRGLLRQAACLRKSAAMSGDAMAAAELIMELRGVFPGVRNPPWTVAEHVALDDLAGAVSLLGELWRTGATRQVAILASRLATEAALDDPAQVLGLIGGLRGAQATGQLAALLARDPAAHVALDDPEAVVALVLELRGADAAGADVNGADAGGQAAALANRAASRYADRDPEAASRASEALRVNLEDHDEAFAFRFIYGSYEPAVAASLLTMLARAGEKEKIRRFLAFLASDPAAEIPLDDPSGVAQLLEALHALNADEQVRALLARDPVARVAPGDLHGAVRMLAALRRLGVAEQYPLRLRDLAGRVTAEDSPSLVLLLRMLAEDGAAGEIAALTGRCRASQVGMRDPGTVAALLDMLRALGEADQAAILVSRMPDEGMFSLFLKQADNATRYRFGRDPGGAPAAPWEWDSLD